MIDMNFLYDGHKAVKKVHPFAKIEAKMLQLLGDFVDVAKVYFVASDTIIMEYIEENCIADEEKAAQTVASLHRQSINRYGLEFDTTIGPFLQPNGLYDSWIEFYAQKRLLYMAKLVLEDALLPSTLFSKIEKLIEKLPLLIPDTPKPALLHGDIWSGNVLCHNKKIYLIDPALYYGHNEVELAFIMMFHTFGDTFFDIYKEMIPIEKEFFEYRYKIYQLYPYLVHLQIYGKSYLPGLESRLNYFI